MKFRNKRVSQVVAVAVAAGGLTILGPIGAAHASDSGCADANNFHTCITIIGTGDYVDYIHVQVTNESVDQSSTFHVELVGPNGHICDSSTVSGSAGTIAEQTCDYNSIVSYGEYCAIAWDWEGGSYYDNDDEECQPVTS